MPREVKLLGWEADPSGWWGGWKCYTATIKEAKQINIISEIPRGINYIEELSASEAEELIEEAKRAGVPIYHGGPLCRSGEGCIALIRLCDGHYLYIAY